MKNIYKNVCNEHVLNMNNCVNSVHNNCLKVTTRHRTANLCSLKKKIGEPAVTNISTIIISVSSGDFAHLRIPGYFAHLLQHLKMKENDNSENSMIKNNPSLV